MDPKRRTSRTRDRCGWTLSAALAMAVTVLVADRCPAAAALAKAPPVRIAYFVPRDRQPAAGYAERLDRVMTEVQRFYREGMAAAGYGPMTFQLDRDAQGRLCVYVVRGRQEMRAYGRDAADAVRREVKAALAQKGLDADHHTLVIFEALLAWDADKATEVGPYCGGGSHLAGTAWVYDDPRLDPRLLGSKAPGGYYGQPCSIGEFNSHYVGGVAHELGHAFGLPHDCQRRSDQSRGVSLMGGGNHTYGQELRGEGPGTFLSPASAMRLAASRPFAGDRDDASQRPECRISGLKADFRQGAIVLSGTLAAKPPALGIAAYNDWVRIPADYDAVGWTCKVGKTGGFQLEVGEMRPGPSQLRLAVCHANGTTSQFSFDYDVDEQGVPTLDVFRFGLPLDEAVKAYAAGDRDRARRLAGELVRQFPKSSEAHRKAAHLCSLLDPAPPEPVGEIPQGQKSAPVSRLEFRSASVGWGRPLRDEVLVEGEGDCFLQVGGRFFESGLYAHAPARHELDLNRAWKRLRSGYGLQDGHAGSVVFVVRGDGRELFRSEVVRDRRLRKLDVDVSGVDRLELSTEDGGDGPASDWSVWIAPQLER